MSWLYKQSTGELFRDGVKVANGYSGAKPDGYNNPDAQQIHNVGPIPCGEYDIGPPSDTKTHGPYVLSLTPSQENEMFGRGGFLVHGDSVVAPGTASEGCIIMARGIRQQIWDSGDRELQVIP